MQKKWKSTVILGIIALLLGVYYSTFEQNRPSDDELKSKQNEIALFTGVSIDAIEFYKDITPIRAELNDGAWKITAPQQLEADGATIQGIINQIIALKSTASIMPTPPTSLVNFGLAPITKKIAFRKTGTTDYTTINIGKENALGTGVYISLNNDQTVYNVPTSITSLAEQNIESLRYKSPTPTPIPTDTPVPTTTAQATIANQSDGSLPSPTLSQ